jgi:hypothetical protein
VVRLERLFRSRVKQAARFDGKFFFHNEVISSRALALYASSTKIAAAHSGELNV